MIGLTVKNKIISILDTRWLWHWYDIIVMNHKKNVQPLQRVKIHNVHNNYRQKKIYIWHFFHCTIASTNLLDPFSLILDMFRTFLHRFHVQILNYPLTMNWSAKKTLIWQDKASRTKMSLFLKLHSNLDILNKSVRHFFVR